MAIRSEKASDRGFIKRVGVYAGSFDPITNGHMFMIREGALLFDDLIVAIGTNPEKTYTFPLEKRLGLVRACTEGIPNVRVLEIANRFLVDFAQEHKAQFILRGIRNPQDYEFERSMRQVNNDLNPRISHVFLIPPRNTTELSSSFVKGLVGPEGWQRIIRQFIPPQIHDEFIRYFTENKQFQNGEMLTGKQKDD